MLFECQVTVLDLWRRPWQQSWRRQKVLRATELVSVFNDAVREVTRRFTVRLGNLMDGDVLALTCLLNVIFECVNNDARSTAASARVRKNLSVHFPATLKCKTDAHWVNTTSCIVYYTVQSNVDKENNIAIRHLGIWAISVSEKAHFFPHQPHYLTLLLLW